MSGLSLAVLGAVKDRFDDSELGSFYRYTRGWVEYGNPAKAYRELIYLFQGFTDICNQHGIEYWLDWGSLLGYLRHNGGVIPWDYDHDVGMRTPMYEKFIATIEKLQVEEAAKSSSSSSSSASEVNTNCTFVLSDFTFAREGARGYYVMSLASHPEIQIDICEYITDTSSGKEILKHNMDDETYEGFFYPDMPIEMVFPLKKVNMLGCPTLIPADSDAVTKLHFGANYMQVLWVPYLLTKLYNPFLTKTLWQPPIREIPIVTSYIDGFAKYGASSPFLVRNPESFRKAVTLDGILKFVSQSKETVFGYDNAGELVEGRLIKDLVREWQDDKLNMKVLDSPLACCQLPADFVALDEEVPSDDQSEKKESDNRNASNAGLGLMLTRANAYTFLHLDPPFYGGGWMYLLTGRKSWHYISPEFIDLLYDPSTKRLRDLPPSELVTRFGYALHGHVLHVTAEANDLVYFPPCWMHRVRTYEKTIGISGYMKVKAAHDNIKKYTKVLEEKGLNSIWNGNADI